MFLAIFSIAYNSVYYVISFFLSFICALHTVLPFGIDVALVGVAAFYITRLKRPDQENVRNIFGPLPGSKESLLYPDKIVKCIAHRGAGLDAPENTLEAFKYCVDRECNFVELDVRTSKDGELVLLHDSSLQRLSGVSTDIREAEWDSVKDIDVGATHPNRHLYKEVHLCLLSEALDYLLSKNVKIIIDVKGDDKQVISGVLRTFSLKPELYQQAVVTTFNPFTLYQIRHKDPQIVGAISYRPYCFSAQDYDAESGPSNPRYGDKLALHGALRVADLLHSLLWRWSARWCAASAVLLHKDIVSPSEVSYWRSLGVRCAGWCVNRPLEKLYWRAVLRAPYLANTLLGEPEEKRDRDTSCEEADRPAHTVDKILDTEKRMTSGQN
ncbi:glycerophosphodiester phosphodiesterase 1 [Bicyclus anynana]|uniref:Glycerophosphodiester phosphodiesterase 1 n=1 Tax=Bicyclus anynana TaxID=110368 RepID=A0ABM3M3T5_BICAN|nr:glycerophosphodiester phosphodiesterase 1 [Bicyclus anynana]